MSKVKILKSEFDRQLKSNVTHEIKKINKELIRIGFSYEEIEQFWMDCIKKAKND
jgi:hypothetical protein